MKLLFENWRTYLNERKTDEIYSRLVDLFVNAYSDDKNFEYKSEQEKEEYEGNFDLEFAAEKFASLVPSRDKAKGKAKEYFMFLLEPRAEEIIEKINKADPEGEIFPQKHRYTEVLPNLIFKYDKKSKSAGTWNVLENEMIIYLNVAVSRQEYDEMTEKDIRKYVRSTDHRSFLRTVINHEFTHYLNSIRAGEPKIMAKSFRDTKRSKQLVQKFLKVFPGAAQDIDGVKDMIAYVNNTEEIQARLIPIYKKIEAFIRSPKDFNNTGKIDELNFIKIEIKSRNPDVKKIVKNMKNIYNSEHRYFWDFTADPLRKRILQRFYEFALDLIKRFGKN